jgi:hypothetical protein
MKEEEKEKIINKGRAIVKYPCQEMVLQQCRADRAVRLQTRMRDEVEGMTESLPCRTNASSVRGLFFIQGNL